MQYGFEAARDKIEELIVVFRAMNLKTRLVFIDPDLSIQVCTIPKEGLDISLTEIIKCDSHAYLRLKSELDG